MDSKSNMTSGATCQRGLRAVSEITVKTLVNYLKLDYESLAEEDILELAAFLQAAIRFICDYTGLPEIAPGVHEKGNNEIYGKFSRDLRVEALDFLCSCRICTITAVFTLIKAT